MRPFDEDDMPVGSDEYADVALMMAAVRDWPSEEFARDLDARVARRFAPIAGASDAGSVNASHRRRWLSLPALGGVGGLVVAGVVAAIVVASSGGNGRLLDTYRPLTTDEHTPATANSGGSASAPASGFKAGGGIGTPAVSRAQAGTSRPLAAASASTNYTTQATSGGAAVPAPATGSNAKQIQSAQISLSAANNHIDQVSSEIFNVVSNEHGWVGSSRITAATRDSGGGYAYFTLSIPTNNLQAAMTQLSRLQYASVSSRTDASQNVGGQYARDERQLHDAQALRISLLKQLQTADSETAIDSIEAQIKTAERQISNAQTTLHSLQHQVSYSKVSVEINSGGLPVYPVAKSSSGFTISHAGHDAIRVLVVAAGVALIALAVLIPVLLVVALLSWIGVALRQRRRERALDAG